MQETEKSHQDSAYKLLGKSILTTSQLVASSQILHNTIPTDNCDVLITFPLNTETCTLMWLLDRLRSRTPHLIVNVRHHSNTKGSVFHITATYNGLLQGAEDLAIRKQLKDDFGGGMKEFSIVESECFQYVEDESKFFNSQERQSIIHHMLYNLRAVQGEQLGKITFLEGQAIFPLLESKKIVSQVFPLHHQESLSKLKTAWVQTFVRFQPLDQICEYFGVKISMYFAYLGHYTLALCVPALLGTCIWFFQGKDEAQDDLLMVLFALFNAFWATLYLEHWKRKSSELAYEWGTLDSEGELLVDPRPLFIGEPVESLVTGRLEPFYPSWKRNLFRYLVSCPVIFVCLMVVFVVMLLIFQLQEIITASIKKEEIPAFTSFLPKILLAVSIGILDDIYKKIAYWLNDKENYRLEETYENHLIVKLALFQFVNAFLSLFYIAFYLRDMDRLRDQLAAILITRQIIGNVKEAVLPYVTWKWKLVKVGYDKLKKDKSKIAEKEESKLLSKIEEEDESETTTVRRNIEQNQVFDDQAKKGETKNLSLTQAEVESSMKKYEDTFEDHLEMFIQFGYVTLFSSAFPLAGLCALLNNIVEIRSDALKLCMNHQRPFGKQVENIGTWQDALELMGVIAVMVNCSLIGISGEIQRMFPSATMATVIIIIVVLEHIMLALKFMIAYAIPDIPESIATTKARMEFLRREALKKLDTKSPSPPPSQMNIKEKISLRQKQRINPENCDTAHHDVLPSNHIASTHVSQRNASYLSSSLSSSSPLISSKTQIVRNTSVFNPHYISGYSQQKFTSSLQNKLDNPKYVLTLHFPTNKYFPSESISPSYRAISRSLPNNLSSDDPIAPQGQDHETQFNLCQNDKFQHSELSPQHPDISSHSSSKAAPSRGSSMSMSDMLTHVRYRETPVRKDVRSYKVSSV